MRVLGGEGWAVCEGEGEEADGGEKGLAEGRGGGGWMAEMQGFVLGEADERIRLGVRKDVWSEFVPRGRDGG